MDDGGCVIYPGVIREVRPDGVLVVEYDSGGEGLERQENVRPRVQMPWQPKHVPLHLMLRRNVGGKRGVLEGLSVRWRFVANVLQALRAHAAPGAGPWRLDGVSEQEPMHKYYDRRRFHVMTVEELRAEYAPKMAGGAVLSPAEEAGLTEREAQDLAVDLETPEQFMAAGFSLRFVGPDDDA
eukprot:2130223-Pyramimonas_sp.AAC.1